MENLGILAALGAAVCWGTYMVPFKRYGHSNLVLFQTLMGVGIGFSGLFMAIVLGYPIGLNWYGLASGVLWTAGNVFGLIAISNLGLSKAVPLISSLVVTLAFLWGTIIFGEMPSGELIGFLGILLILVGVILVSFTSNVQSQNTKKGFAAAIGAGVIWGSQLVPLKLGNVSTKDFFFPVCLGILVSGLILFVVLRGKFQKGAVGLSFLSGFIWNIGNLLSLFAVSLIGLSKAGPVSQVATLVAVTWGLIYFKEIKSLRIKLQILIGAVILLIGILILGIA